MKTVYTILLFIVHIALTVYLAYVLIHCLKSDPHEMITFLIAVLVVCFSYFLPRKEKKEILMWRLIYTDASILLYIICYGIYRLLI